MGKSKEENDKDRLFVCIFTVHKKDWLQFRFWDVLFFSAAQIALLVHSFEENISLGNFFVAQACRLFVLDGFDQPFEAIFSIHC